MKERMALRAQGNAEYKGIREDRIRAYYREKREKHKRESHSGFRSGLDSALREGKENDNPKDGNNAEESSMNSGELSLREKHVFSFCPGYSQFLWPSREVPTPEETALAYNQRLEARARRVAEAQQNGAVQNHNAGAQENEVGQQNAEGELQQNPGDGQNVEEEQNRDPNQVEGRQNQDEEA
jgi:hypothetical protein